MSISPSQFGPVLLDDPKVIWDTEAGQQRDEEWEHTRSLRWKLAIVGSGLGLVASIVGLVFYLENRAALEKELAMLQNQLSKHERRFVESKPFYEHFAPTRLAEIQTKIEYAKRELTLRNAEPTRQALQELPAMFTQAHTDVNDSIFSELRKPCPRRHTRRYQDRSCTRCRYRFAIWQRGKFIHWLHGGRELTWRP